MDTVSLSSFSIAGALYILLQIFVTGHILRYVPADVAHILYDGSLSCSGNPQEMLECIGNEGYEHCIQCRIQEGKA